MIGREMKNRNGYFQTDASIQFAVVIVVLFLAAIVDWILC